MEDSAIVIKGCPRDRWEQVQGIQHQAFIYIMSNGSKWAGDEEDNIAELVDALGKYALDFDRFPGNFRSVDPCHWAYNPRYPATGEPQYIDGARMYQCDGVVRFFGNFLEVSHVFHIDTNHRPTIDALVAAIDANRIQFGQAVIQ